jgi:hypothetical protein
MFFIVNQGMLGAPVCGVLLPGTEMPDDALLQPVLRVQRVVARDEADMAAATGQFQGDSWAQVVILRQGSGRQERVIPCLDEEGWNLN